MTRLHFRPNYLSIVRTRPAAMNPYTEASATGAQVIAIHAGSLTAYFGRDLDARTAAARAYLRSKQTLATKLKRIIGL